MFLLIFFFFIYIPGNIWMGPKSTDIIWLLSIWLFSTSGVLYITPELKNDNLVVSGNLVQFDGAYFCIDGRDNFDIFS